MSDPSAPGAHIDSSVPHQLRSELTALQRQLEDIQTRIAELQLDTSPEPPAEESWETRVERGTEVGEQPEITLAELQKRLADRLRSLDAELKENKP
jgi:hypothetical protein